VIVAGQASQAAEDPGGSDSQDADRDRGYPARH